MRRLSLNHKTFGIGIEEYVLFILIKLSSANCILKHIIDHKKLYFVSVFEYSQCSFRDEMTGIM
jgi:hypothetical protein